MTAGTTATGIRTLYRGVSFRSRLEARWAAMFDQLGWRWDYEPLDLAGYIPDFILRLTDPLLVEVKPAMALADLKAHTEKIEGSGWQGEALLVGATLFTAWGHTLPALGLLAEWHVLEDEHGVRREGFGGWDPAIGFRCRHCLGLTLASSTGSYRCRRGGCHDGDHFIGDPGMDFEAAWAQAGNEVQWSPR